MSRRGWVLFGAMCVIWGIPYLFIKVAVEEISPSMLVLGRTAIGALVLVPLAARSEELRPLLRAWPRLEAIHPSLAIPTTESFEKKWDYCIQLADTQ